jgi:uncharacterized SAM-dependent methyltransferase
MVAPIADPVTLLELGCGSGEKVALLAEALRNRRRRVAIHLIDISPTALELSERTLGALEHVSVVGHRATYEEGLRHAARERPPRGGLLVLFLGSNIGNFDPPATASSSGRTSSSRWTNSCSPTTTRSESRRRSTGTCSCG